MLNPQKPGCSSACSERSLWERKVAGSTQPLIGANPTSYFKADALLHKEVKRLGYKGITFFNDRPGRTQAEVIELFDKVIGGLHN